MFTGHYFMKIIRHFTRLVCPEPKGRLIQDQNVVIAVSKHDNYRKAKEVPRKIKRMPIRPDFRVIGVEIAILVGLLLTGGFVEYYYIESITTDMPKL